MSDYKLWKDMTPAEKGALPLAHHEGKTFEISNLLPGDEWTEIKEPIWMDSLAYRVKEKSTHKWAIMVGSFVVCVCDTREQAEKNPLLRNEDCRIVRLVEEKE